jgi:hypothetical protein
LIAGQATVDSRAAALSDRIRSGTENIGDHLAATKSLF